MSSRERWTVYPLLFLTLGIALKDKVTREITTDRVSCKALLVTDRHGDAQLALASTPTGGRVSIRGQDGMNVILGHAGEAVGLMLFDPRGNLMRSLAVRSTQPQQHEPAASPNRQDDASPPVRDEHDEPPSSDPSAANDGR